MTETDVIILGASASGLMCAIEAGKRGKKVIVLDHANKAGKKILMSGGGKCNFTNYDVSPANYISSNPHFCKSALSRYTQWDFIALVEKHNIPYHEREHGQLFCNQSSKDILTMLLTECKTQHATISLDTEIINIEKNKNKFVLTTSNGNYHSHSLVIATGGLSIPKMGASPFGYHIAEKFNIKINSTRAGLVPFTLHQHDKNRFAPLSGIAIDTIVSSNNVSFRENILFTHRGLSGPAILQVSSYWQSGDPIIINLLPDQNMQDSLQQAKQQQGKQKLKNHLYQLLPRRVINTVIDNDLLEQKTGEITDDQLQNVATTLHNLVIKPNGTEGYRTRAFCTHKLVNSYILIYFSLYYQYFTCFDNLSKYAKFFDNLGDIFENCIPAAISKFALHKEQWQNWKKGIRRDISFI